MRPLVTPASTVNMAAAIFITTIVSWVLKQFAGVEVPEPVAQAFTGICTLLAGHFTHDSPPKEEVKQIVDYAATKDRGQ